jgi:nucleoside-diphosphate-sugar epimerase
VNVCSGKPTRVRDLLGALNAMIGDSIVIDEESADESAPASWSVGDPTKCRALLGFAPSGDLAATMRRLVDVTLPARVADLRQCGRPIAPASGKLFAESKADD